jgi:heat shock protein HtpX
MGSYLRTVLLLGILSVFLILIGGALGGRGGLNLALLFSLLMNGVAYFFSDRIALAASRAKPLPRDQAPEIYQIVEDLCRKSGIPTPKLYITPASQANAFATGRSPSHASVAVTQGLLDNLSFDEIKGVLAHELAHVKNRDILIASVAAVLASAIAFVSRFGLYGGFSDDDNRGSGGMAIFLAIFGPLAAMLVQFAISRQREFAADAQAARTIGTGEPLAEALIKISESAKRKPLLDSNPAFSSLYIGNPFGGTGGRLLNLFSTHPPVAERVERLREITF